MTDDEKEERQSFIQSLLKKAFGKDPEPKAYKKDITEEDIKEVEEHVKKIKEKVR